MKILIFQSEMKRRKMLSILYLFYVRFFFSMEKSEKLEHVKSFTHVVAHLSYQKAVMFLELLQHKFLQINSAALLVSNK